MEQPVIVLKDGTCVLVSENFFLSAYHWWEIRRRSVVSNVKMLSMKL